MFSVQSHRHLRFGLVLLPEAALAPWTENREMNFLGTQIPKGQKGLSLSSKKNNSLVTWIATVFFLTLAQWLSMAIIWLGNSDCSSNWLLIE